MRVINTQTNVGGGQLAVYIPCPVGNYIEITHLGIGADNYAADKALIAYHYDDGPNILCSLLKEAAFDNKIIRLIETAHGGTAVVDTEDIVGASKLPFVLRAGNHIEITVTIPVQNETLTVTIEGKCKILPVPSAAGSDGSPALTTTYNETV